MKKIMFKYWMLKILTPNSKLLHTLLIGVIVMGIFTVTLISFLESIDPTHIKMFGIWYCDASNLVLGSAW